MEIRKANSSNDLEGILKLQNENHFDNLVKGKSNEDGFVTVKHTLEMLEKMQVLLPQVVATENNTVVAYALSMHRDLKNEIPILIPMFDIFDKLSYNHKPLNEYDYYVMGQICIEKKHRRTGLFKSLYLKHRALFNKQFYFCLTEVSAQNERSLGAHQKIGFQSIHENKDQTDNWHILLWDWA